jgi:predicted transposase
MSALLKLMTTPEQHQLLRQTQLAYRHALNFVSRYAFEQGKTSNTDRLQKGTYHEIRLLYRLPSQMACNVPRQVAGTYKGLWTRHERARDGCPLFAKTPVFGRLIGLGTLCQFNFDRTERSLEALDDADHLEGIGHPIVLLLSHVCF